MLDELACAVERIDHPHPTDIGPRPGVALLREPTVTGKCGPQVIANAPVGGRVGCRQGVVADLEGHRLRPAEDLPYGRSAGPRGVGGGSQLEAESSGRFGLRGHGWVDHALVWDLLVRVVGGTGMLPRAGARHVGSRAGGLGRIYSVAPVIPIEARPRPKDPGRPTHVTTRMMQARGYLLSHLDTLEAEAVTIMREVAAETRSPVLLFSGGKDSIVLLRLAEKAFRPARFPFPVMHVDTGHNFPEAIEYRDRRMAEIGERLVVASVRNRSIEVG